MAEITQNKQRAYFHCGPQKNLDNKKSKKGVSKSFKDSKVFESINPVGFFENLLGFIPF